MSTELDTVGTDAEAVTACCGNAEAGCAVSAPSVKSAMRMVFAAGRVMSFIESSPETGVDASRIEA
jgi:hypothetical protein